jgi:hypothetical protein
MAQMTFRSFLFPLQPGKEQGHTVLWKGEYCEVVKVSQQGHRAYFSIRTKKGRILTVTAEQVLKGMEKAGLSSTGHLKQVNHKG